MLYAIIGAVLVLFAGVGLFAGAELWIVGLHFVLGIAGLVYGGLSSMGEMREALGRGSSRRGARFGGNALTQTLLLVVVLGLIAFISVRNPVQWDWTEGGVHTLAQGSRDLLAQVPEDRPIEIYAFFTAGSEAPARRVLDLYTYESDRVSVAYYDPTRHPGLADRFEIDRDGVMIVCSGPCDSAVGTMRVIEPVEPELTSAIRSVISDQKKVYFVAGHGEGALDDESADGMLRAATFLGDENVKAESLLLANEAAVPDDADAVVLAGPQVSVFDRELELLDRYVRGGGAVLVMADPIVVTNLEKAVSGWGIELGNNVIVDETIGLFQGPKLGVRSMVSTYADHPVTEKMSGLLTMFNLARSVRAVGDGDGVVELATTGPRAWADTDVEQFSLPRPTVSRDPAVDLAGPVALAVARTFAPSGNGEVAPTEDGPEREGRLIVVGDSDFARNSFLTSAGNADLFINMVTWLVGEESFITVDRKLPRASGADMTGAQVATFRYLSLFVLPEGILLLGILNWWRRRE